MDNLNGILAEISTFEIEMFPNPSKDLVTVKANAALMQIEVVNTLGQLVIREQVNAANKVDINIASLPAGLYLVKVKSATEVTVKHSRKLD